jgi:hydroxymethylbilane synthase
VAPPDGSRALRLGTRGGDLALWQAREVARLVARAHPEVAIEIVVIRTTGDRVTGVPVAQIGGTGVFTREIESALRTGAIDLAVHSLKDLPSRDALDLALAAIVERADPRDALVAPPGARIDDLPAGARVGTSSARRRAQLLACRPLVRALDVRGNVPTRIAKLDRGEYDALVLAYAGLQRLGLESRVAEIIEPGRIMPAPGQGALAVEIRRDDAKAAHLVGALDHRPTRLATTAERAVLAALDAGCHAPVGALGSWVDNGLALTAVVAVPDGSRIIRREWRGAVRTEAEADAAGRALAEDLLRDGAAEIVAGCRPASEARDGFGSDQP